MALLDTTPSATEEADRAAIVHGILAIQAALAAKQRRPLGRGTHTKGVCVRAQFEIFDLQASGLAPANGLGLAFACRLPGEEPMTCMDVGERR